MIIGIAGEAGSGKDAVAKFLGQVGFATVSLADPLKRICAEVYGFSVEQLWGPSAMRNAPDERYPREHTVLNDAEHCACCGVDFAAIDVPGGGPQCFLTPRYALQMLGTEWGRHCYPDTWVKKMLEVATTLLGAEAREWTYLPWAGLARRDPVEGQPGATGVAVPDVRWPEGNEGYGIRRAGGRVIGVRRPGAGLKGQAAQHESERLVREASDRAFDQVIINDGDLVVLGERVFATIRLLRGEDG